MANEDYVDGRRGEEAPIYAIHAEAIPVPAGLAQWVGKVVVEWSWLEHAISTDLRMLLRHPALAEEAKHFPVAFNKKIELWRSAVTQVFPHTASFHELAKMVTKRSKTAAGWRNHVVHGVWPYEETKPGNATYSVLLPHKKLADHHYELEVGPEFLEALHSEIIAISGIVSGFTVTRMLHARAGVLRPLRQLDDTGKTTGGPLPSLKA